MSKDKRAYINSINKQLTSVLQSKEKLQRMLYLEKHRRRLSQDELVFIGMADVASYFWCAMKSLYKNREMELAFFSSYLHDRILYSARLGLIDGLPDSEEQWLEIGDTISFGHIETLLKEQSEHQGRIMLIAGVTVDEDGNRILVVGKEEREYLEQEAKSRGLRIVAPEEAPPMVRGSLLQYSKGEQYPTIRWNFSWGKYVVVGVPDGITPEFVYEFKTTRSRFLMSYLKPVALVQADLYGYFFRRNRKRVQIYLVEENKTETWVCDVDADKAISVLTDFAQVEQGAIPRPPKAWKCKHCEYAARCTMHLH